MAILTTNGDTLVDENTEALTDELAATTFPLMLMMRLRLHAMWLLFILIPS
jgi:hypothetical protein